MRRMKVNRSIEDCPGALEPERLVLTGKPVSAFFAGRFCLGKAKPYDVWVTFTGKGWLLRICTEISGVYSRVGREILVGLTLTGTCSLKKMSRFYKRFIEAVWFVPFNDNVFVKAYRHAADLQIKGTEFHSWIGELPEINLQLRALEPEQVFDEKLNLKPFKRHFLGRHFYFEHICDFFIEGATENSMRMFLECQGFYFAADIYADIATREYEIIRIAHEGPILRRAGQAADFPCAQNGTPELMKIAFAKAFEELFWHTASTETTPKKKDIRMPKDTPVSSGGDDCPDVKPETIFFAPSQDPFPVFRTPRTIFVGHVGNYADEIEFLGRAIWFDQEVDLWLYYLTQPGYVPSFGFMMVAPNSEENSRRFDFEIPGNAFDFSVKLNSYSPAERDAITQVLAFIKTCKLADKFLLDHGYDEGTPYDANS